MLCVPCLSNMCTALRVDSILKSCSGLFKKNSYTFSESRRSMRDWHLRDLHFKPWQSTVLLREPCSWGLQGVRVPCAITKQVQSHFLSCNQIKQKKTNKKDGWGKYSYFKSGFTYFLPLKINFSFESVLVVTFCKSGCM